MSYKITESYKFAYIMSLLGGFIGAYSYVVRGGIFASAQTGNLIQLGLKITEGNFSAWHLHILPIFMFGIGIILCESLKNYWGNTRKIHWKQGVLLVEGIGLVMISFIPLGDWDVYANMGVGFIAGMQTQLIRVVDGTVVMTTMLTGNARVMAEEMFYVIKNGDRFKGYRVVKQLGIIIAFIVGVMYGGVVGESVGQTSIVYGLLLIIIAQILIYRHKDNI